MLHSSAHIHRGVLQKLLHKHSITTSGFEELSYQRPPRHETVMHALDHMEEAVQQVKLRQRQMQMSIQATQTQLKNEQQETKR